MLNVSKDILEKHHLKILDKIDIGWSSDQKYLVTDGQDFYVLRIADARHYLYKQKEYQLIQTLYKQGVQTHEPIAFGQSQDHQQSYILVRYIKGDQAEVVLPKMTHSEQYQYGIDMGKDLKKIHNQSYQEKSNWKEIYTKKILSRIQSLKETGYKNDYLEHMVEYIKEHLHLLNHRPLCQNHGDFHVGNMIISPDNKSYIIDYNRHKLADPYYEFNRIYFSYRVSPHFAKGMIDGYFDGKIPNDFFRYMKFYLVSVMIGNIPWAMKFDETDVEFAKKSIEDVYFNYQNLSLDIPLWYKNS